MNAAKEHPHFSVTRMLAVLVKEFRHMVAATVLLLLAWRCHDAVDPSRGCIEDGDPKQLPADCLVAADASGFPGASIEDMRIALFRNGPPAQQRDGGRSPAEGRAGDSVVIPPDFGRTLMRAQPVALVAADATHPSATGNAINAHPNRPAHARRDLVGVGLARAGSFGRRRWQSAC